LRAAIFEDCKLLFDWANDIDVRRNSINQTSIEWSEHVGWFQKKKESPHSKIFILEDHLLPIGQIRIDLLDSVWFIDFSVDKNFRGQGYGLLLVESIITKFSTFNFKANVRIENSASAGIFEKLHFRRVIPEESDVFTFEFRRVNNSIE
jgi:RimJ/RimL family protein N-acetyltransferase